MRKNILFASVALVTSTSAFAHPGHGLESGFAAGLLHPLTGWDHLLVMLSLGLWAARRPQGQGWLLPLLFVLSMTVAALTAMTWLSVSLAEMLVTTSVLLMGGLLLTEVRLSRRVQLAGVLLIGIAHGYLHGQELGQHWTTLVGMVCATAALHAAGWWLGRQPQPWARRVRQGLGGGMLLLGAGFLLT